MGKWEDFAQQAINKSAKKNNFGVNTDAGTAAPEASSSKWDDYVNNKLGLKTHVDMPDYGNTSNKPNTIKHTTKAGTVVSNGNTDTLKNKISNLSAQRDNLVYQGRFDMYNNPYDSQITDLNKQLSSLKTELDAVETPKRYNSLSDNADYKQKSQTNIDFNNWQTDKRLSDNDFLAVNNVGGWQKFLDTADTHDKQSVYKYMTADEVLNYNYIYSTKGKKQAEEYIDYLYNDLDKRMTADTTQDMSQYASEHPIAASIGSVPTNIIGGVAGTASIVGQNISNSMKKNKGEAVEPVDYNTYGMLGSAMTNTLRGTVADNLNKKGKADIPIIGEKGLGDLYQLGMSMVDSYSLAVTGGKATNLVLGASAAADGYRDAKEKGLSDDQAFMLGGANGVFEALFEEVSIDKLLKIKDARTISQVIQNVLQQSFTEGSEEFFTTIANTIADNLISGDKSDINKNITQYVAQGMSAEEAKNQAWKDWGSSLAWDFVGGALTGGIMGGVQTGVQTGIQNSVYNDIGKQINDSGKPELLQKLTEQYGDEINISKNPSNKQLGQVYSDLQNKYAGEHNTNIQTAVSDRLRETGMKDADVKNAQTAISKVLNNEKLGIRDTKIMTDKRVQNVIDEISNGGEWANNLLDRNALVSEKSKMLNRTLNTKSENSITENNISPEIKTEKPQGSVINENGEAEKISNVSVTDDGNTVITFSDGTQKDFADVDLSDTELNDVILAASQYGSEANNMVLGYTAENTSKPLGERQSAETYIRQYNNAYDYGKMGASLEYTKNSSVANTLTNEQLEMAYNTGVKDSYKEAKTKQQQIIESRQVGQKKQGNVSTVNLSEETRKNFNSDQKTVISFAKQLSKYSGINIVFEESAVNAEGDYTSPNGWIDGSGTIHIDINAGADNVSSDRTFLAYTLSHELTHFAEKWSPEDYKKYSDFVVDVITQNKDMSIEALLQHKKDNYFKGELSRLKQMYPNVSEEKLKQHITPMSDEASLKEVVADGSQMILTNSNLIERLASHDKTLFEKVKDAVIKIIQELKNLYNGYMARGAEAKAALSYLDELTDMWTNMQEKAVQSYNEAEIKNDNTDEVQFKVRNVDGKDVVWIDENILKENKDNLPVHQFIANYIAEHIGEVYRIIESGQKVYIGESLPREYTQSKYTKYLLKKQKTILDSKNKAISGIGEMIEIATNRRWEKTKHSKNKDAKYGIYRYDVDFAYPVKNQIGDIRKVDAFTAELVILNSSDGKKYLYDIVNIRKDSTVGLKLTNTKPRRGGKNATDQSAIYNDIIRNKAEKNNDIQKKSEDNTGNQYKERDSEDRELSKEQAEFFKNVSPKLRDENGNIKPFYHGTSRADRVGNVFLPERATSGPMSFFTDSRKIAENYAKDKQDTSIAYDEDYDSFETQFRAKTPSGKDVGITELWDYLPSAKKNEIKKKAEQLTNDDDDHLYLEKSNKYGNGGYDIRYAHGNALQGLIDSWLAAGYFMDEEERFNDVLKMVGIDNSYYKNPNYREEKIYGEYLNITNPFDTAEVTEDFADKLEEFAETAEVNESQNSDMWDKNNWTADKWLEKLRDDIENGTSYAWTSIPDFVTEYLKTKGYDGIIDKGGKSGGENHTVAIPFYSNQIKNVDNLNPTENIDIRYQERTTKRADREKIVSLLEGSNLNAAERELLNSYKSKIEDLNKKEADYNELRLKLNEIVYMKGARQSEIDSLTKRRDFLRNQIARQDMKLTKFEAMETMKNLISKERAIAIKNYREGREAAQTREQIKKIVKDFNSRLMRPTKKKYIPVNFTRMVIDFCDSINLDDPRIKSDTTKSKLAKIRDTYKSYKEDSTYDYVYDEVVADMLDNLQSEIEDVPLNKMTKQQLKYLKDCLTALHKNVTQASRLFSEEYKQDMFETGRKVMTEVNEATFIHQKFSKVFDTAQDITLWQLSPDRFFSYLAGFKKDSTCDAIGRTFKNATEKKLMVQRTFTELFRSYENTKFINSLSDTKNLVDIGIKDQIGHSVMLTKGMMLSVYKHLSSEDNKRAFAYGGFTVPDMKQYYSGKMQDSFARGSLRTLPANTELIGLNEKKMELLKELKDLQEFKDIEGVNQDDVYDIYDEIEILDKKIAEAEEVAENEIKKIRLKCEDIMTAEERAFIDSTTEWYDKHSKDYINEVTLKMYGIKKAGVKNYYTIHRDASYFNTQFESMVNNITLENWGSLKDRVKSVAPIMLTDILMELQSSVEQVSSYFGYVEATRDFNRIYNVRNKDYSMSVKEAIKRKGGAGNRKFGVTGEQYIENLLTDLSGKGRRESSILEPVRRNLARATLSVNLRVALSQAASIPTAAAEVGWKVMAKGYLQGWAVGFSEKKKDELAEKNVWFWQRYRGEGSTREFAEMKGGDNPVDKAWNWIDEKTHRKLLNWCQNVDVYSTASMYNMAEVYVQDVLGIKKSAHNYEYLVNEKFTDILRKTQPNYTTTERSALLRDKRETYKILTMYKTQSNQNFNIMYESLARLSKYKSDYNNGRNDVTKADVTQAVQQCAGASTAVVIGGTITFAVLRLVANALQRTMDVYRDDDDEVTLESTLTGILKDSGSAIAGCFVLGSQIYDILVSKFSDSNYYGLSDSALSAVSDIVEQITNGSGDAVSLTGKLLQVLGLPYKNVRNICNGISGYIEGLGKGNLFGFEDGADRTASMQGNRMYKAISSGDEDKYEKLYSELYDSYISKGKTETEAESQVRSILKKTIKSEYADGSITDDNAGEMLKKYLDYSENDVYWELQEWNFKPKNSDEKFNKYADLDTAVMSGNKSTVNSQSKYLQKHGIEEQAIKNHITAEIKDMYINGKITKTQAKKLLVNVRELSYDNASKGIEKWDESRNKTK